MMYLDSELNLSVYLESQFGLCVPCFITVNLLTVN